MGTRSMPLDNHWTSSMGHSTVTSRRHNLYREGAPGSLPHYINQIGKEGGVTAGVRSPSSKRRDPGDVEQLRGAARPFSKRARPGELVFASKAPRSLVTAIAVSSSSLAIRVYPDPSRRLGRSSRINWQGSPPATPILGESPRGFVAPIPAAWSTDLSLVSQRSPAGACAPP